MNTEKRAQPQRSTNGEKDKSTEADRPPKNKRPPGGRSHRAVVKQSTGSAGVRLQPGSPLRVSQLEHRHLLDLADALPGQPELATHLVEGALPAVVEAEAEADHRGL